MSRWSFEISIPIAVIFIGAPKGLILAKCGLKAQATVRVTLELSWRPKLCGGFGNQGTYGLPAQESVQNTAVGQQMEHTRHRGREKSLVEKPFLFSSVPLCLCGQSFY